MNRLKNVGVAFVIVLLAGASNAWASSIMFSDLSSWQSAVAALGYNSSIIDFDNAVKTNFSTVTTGNVVFSSVINTLPLVVESEPISPQGSGNVLDVWYDQNIQVTLPGSTYAFGFDLWEISPLSRPGSGIQNVVLSTGDVFLGPYYNSIPYPGGFTFFGFLSDSPVTSFTMDPFSYSDAIIDNFRYAQTGAPVPEPTTILLISLGLFGFGIVRRRMKK